MADAPTPPRLGVAYELVGELPAARADLPLLLTVRVRNVGAAAWSHRGGTPVTLSYHWLDAAGRVVDYEGLRATLPGPLRPGESVELALQAEPPPGPGQYTLALDMVEEGRDWFSNRGVPPLLLPVAVRPGQAGAPRVCIVNGNCMAHDALGNHVVNQLRFFQARGYHALVLVEHSDPRHPPELRQHIARVTLDDLRGLSDNPQTRRAVQHFRSAGLYVFNYSAYYELVEAIRLVGQGVLIFDYHGVTPPHLWGGAGDEMLVEGQRQLQLARYADYAVAHSGFTRAELLSSGAVVPDRAHAMAYVVPLARFSPGPRRADLLARYGLDAGQPLLLYVGRMAANKRIGTLVRALPLIRHALPRAALLLVGDTEFPPHAREVALARALAQELGVADGLAFAGQVDDAELPDHYRLADLFVTASLHEGFCIPVVEAMACGVPVVGAHATALPETIGSGGLTFEPENPADLAAKVLALLQSRR